MTVPAAVTRCAPGRRLDAAIVLALKGEQVTAVKESRMLEGDDIILVNETAIADALDPGRLYEMIPPSGYLDRSPFDPLRVLCEDMAREYLSRPFVMTGIA